MANRHPEPIDRILELLGKPSEHAAAPKQPRPKRSTAERVTNAKTFDNALRYVIADIDTHGVPEGFNELCERTDRPTNENGTETTTGDLLAHIVLITNCHPVQYQKHLDELTADELAHTINRYTKTRLQPDEHTQLINDHYSHLTTRHAKTELVRRTQGTGMYFAAANGAHDKRALYAKLNRDAAVGVAAATLVGARGTTFTADAYTLAINTLANLRNRDQRTLATINRDWQNVFAPTDPDDQEHRYSTTMHTATGVPATIVEAAATHPSPGVSAWAILHGASATGRRHAFELHGPVMIFDAGATSATPDDLDIVTNPAHQYPMDQLDCWARTIIEHEPRNAQDPAALLSLIDMDPTEFDAAFIIELCTGHSRWQPDPEHAKRIGRAASIYDVRMLFFHDTDDQPSEALAQIVVNTPTLCKSLLDVAHNTTTRSLGAAILQHHLRQHRIAWDVIAALLPTWDGTFAELVDTAIAADT